ADPSASQSSMARPSVAAAPSPAPAGVASQVPATGIFVVTRSARAVTSAAARISSWTPVPGHPAYAMSDFDGDPYASSFGQCTWYAWSRHGSLPLLKLGNASAWPRNAHRFGLHVSTRPHRGATVIFQPGVQGASRVGHAGVVESILRGGWLIISEMNFRWN